MELLILFGRLVLAGVMGIAGVSKLADLPGSRQAMQDFGIPATLAPILGLLLPIAELFATMLVLTPLAWWGALLSFLLLLAFIGGISYNLWQGKAPDCHCFGQIHSEPIGWTTLIRNGALAVLALWLLLQGNAHLPSNGPALWISLIILLIALGEGWWLLKLRQQNALLHQHIEAMQTQNGTASPILTTATKQQGLYIGSPAPFFHLTGMDGETTTLHALLAAQKPLHLFFIDPTCGSCNELLPEIEAWQRAYANRLTIVPISRGNVGSNRASKQGLQNVLLQEKAEVSTAYHIERMPSALLIHADGTIASAIATGADAIRAQIAQFTQPLLDDVDGVNTVEKGNEQSEEYDYCPNGIENSTALHPIPQRGELAPDFILPDLEGEMLGLDPLRGYQLLLIFWNPTCDNCHKMLAEIKAIEEDRPLDAPQILFIATGAAEANHVQELHSPILLDSDLATTRRYGVIGTPAALLIDAHGRIATDVALGSKAVHTLLKDQILSVR